MDIQSTISLLHKFIPERLLKACILNILHPELFICNLHNVDSKYIAQYICCFWLAFGKIIILSSSLLTHLSK